MFTGIVEEVGRVASIGHTEEGARITITASVVLHDTRIGESIAINGACLTVVDLSPTTFAVEATQETLRRTNLGTLERASSVHLERALRADGRFGGHFVQGHIDGTGEITAREAVGDAIVQTFSAPPEVIAYLVSKGSVTVDGVSLTVVNVGPDWFDVWLIPHTIAVTHLVTQPIGASVNLEADILAKYVAQAVLRSQS